MRLRLFATSLLAAVPLLAFPQQDALYLSTLAATCANCHGTEGRPVAGSPLPPLAGMPREQMLARLQAFKSGAQPATIMHQLSKGFSDSQLEQLAAYFAAQKK